MQNIMQRRLLRPRQVLAPKKKTSFCEAWNHFFFRRTSIDGCRVAGAIRILFALLFLLDRLVLGRDLDFFLSPSKGVVPSTLSTTTVSPITWTLFHVNLQSDEWLWLLHWVSFGQGILLLLGILPRLQVVGIYLNLVSLHRHNDLIYDDEDTMMRLWCFLLLFLPLHHLTIYDVFRKHRWRDESWPMWPFRLWQLEICLIYASSAISKWVDNPSSWMNGTAVYYMTQSREFFPGIYSPEFLFHRSLPLKLVCWYVFLIESICWLSVWIEDSATDTIATMVVLHATIDVMTNRLCFNWLAIVGWLTFMVKGDYQPPKERRRYMRTGIVFPPQPPRTPNGILGSFVHLFIALLALGMIVDTLPTQIIVSEAYRDMFNKARARYLDPITNATGIRQGSWNLYNTDYFLESSYYQAFIQLHDGNVIDRRSPSWRSMQWWERKAATRLMKFYANFANSRETWVDFCHYIVDDIKEDVKAIELVRLWERARPPLKVDEWLAPVQRPPEKGWDSLVVLNFCSDKSEQCAELASRGACTDSPIFMKETCPRTCRVCGKPTVTWGSNHGIHENTARPAGSSNEDISAQSSNWPANVGTNNGSQFVMVDSTTDTNDECQAP